MNENIIKPDFSGASGAPLKKKRKRRKHLPSWAKVTITVVSILLVLAILFSACLICPLVFAGVLIGIVVFMVSPESDGTFYYYVSDGEVSINGLVDSDFSGALYIPEYIEGKPVTYIDTSAFEYSSITELYLPSTLTSISSFAFYGCKSLTKVQISEGLLSIGYFSFAYCSNLAEIYIPDTVYYISSQAFLNCYSLEKIDLPSSLENIGYSAFSGCSSLEEITIPKSCQYIGSGAFSGCEALNSITFESTKDWQARIYENGKYTYADSIDLSDKEKNATLFKTTYVEYTWEVICQDEDKGLEL